MLTKTKRLYGWEAVEKAKELGVYVKTHPHHPFDGEDELPHSGVIPYLMEKDPMLVYLDVDVEITRREHRQIVRSHW